MISVADCLFKVFMPIVRTRERSFFLTVNVKIKGFFFLIFRKFFMPLARKYLVGQQH